MCGGGGLNRGGRNHGCGGGEGEAAARRDAAGVSHPPAGALPRHPARPQLAVLPRADVRLVPTTKATAPHAQRQRQIIWPAGVRLSVASSTVSLPKLRSVRSRKLVRFFAFRSRPRFLRGPANGAIFRRPLSSVTASREQPTRRATCASGIVPSRAASSADHCRRCCWPARAWPQSRHDCVPPG